MDKKFLKTYFFCVIGTLLLAFLLWKWRDTASFIGFLFGVFRPVIIGVVIASLLNRPFERIKGVYSALLPKISPKTKHILAVITLYLLLFGILAGILMVVIPQVYDSIRRFVDHLEEYYQNITDTAESLLSFGGHNLWQELQLEEKLQSFIRELPDFLQKASSRIADTFGKIIGGIADASVGIVLSIYGLSQKEKLARQAKQILKAFVGEKYVSHTIRFFSLVGHTFSGFFSGQLTEVMVLGVLCFLGMTLFGFEYPLLISVITAVSNLVPIVGPIVGTIPSVFILFLTEPRQAIWFLVFIIILQQLEANFIYPKIVGGSVGLPGMWVLLSIILGGSLFGISGMLFAIPTVSVLYQLLKQYVAARTVPELLDDGREELAVFTEEGPFFSKSKRK